MKGEYQIVRAKNLIDLKERMEKYNVTALGNTLNDNGVFTQFFYGEKTAAAIEAGVAKVTAAAEKKAALDEKYAAKRAAQAEAAKKVSPVGKNFKKGSPIDRDFQEQVAKGLIDSNGNTISPRAKLAAEKKATKAKGKTTTGEGFAVVEGEIPADMR